MTFLTPNTKHQTPIKRALFFDPYLDTLGGGERYVLTLAEYLVKKSWEVEIVWLGPPIEKKIKERLGLDLSGAKFIPASNRGLGYDFYFHLSDGSVPLMLAKKNVLHFQVPFHDIGGKSLRKKIKLMKISSVVCNSYFTKRFIDQEFGLDSRVIYPPVDTKSFRPLTKENLIVSVGRFSHLLQSKRQDVLLGAFRKMIEGGLKNWKLVLAGGTDVGGEEFFRKLEKGGKGYSVELKANPALRTVRDLYGKAKIFWSASGFGVDEEKNPEKAEHFGIAVVEAMAAGCVPIVVGKGGIKEIINDRQTGFFWDTATDLTALTRRLINNPRLLSQISARVVESSRRFSVEHFYESFDQLL